jgi:hypothetical protein
MRIGTRSIGPVSCVIASFIAASAYPNGRQPPRSSDISPVKATCEERSGGNRHEIFRARITAGDGSAERLNVLIGNASEQIAIADIKTLTLPNARVDPDGFMKATLVRGDDTEKRSVMVEVRSGKANLRLAGFRNNGTSVNIDLSRCKTVEFSSGARSGGDSGDRPVTKK